VDELDVLEHRRLAVEADVARRAQLDVIGLAAVDAAVGGGHRVGT